jgi:hypothetical protein
MQSTEPTMIGPDPYFAFMDAQRAADKAAFERRIEAKYSSAHQISPIAQVIEFKPRQVAVAVHHHTQNEIHEIAA